MILQITNQTILGVCVFWGGGVWEDSLPSVEGSLGLLPCSLAPSSLGKVVTLEAERTHVLHPL